MGALLFIPNDPDYFRGWLDGSHPPMAGLCRAGIPRWLPGGYLGWSRERAAGLWSGDYALVLVWDGAVVQAGVDRLAAGRSWDGTLAGLEALATDGRLVRCGRKLAAAA